MIKIPTDFFVSSELEKIYENFYMRDQRPSNSQDTLEKEKTMVNFYEENHF